MMFLKETWHLCKVGSLKQAYLKKSLYGFEIGKNIFERAGKGKCYYVGDYVGDMIIAEGFILHTNFYFNR